MLLDPGRVAHRRCGTRHEEVAVGSQPGHGDVGLVAGPLVEHARVDDLAHVDRHVGGAQALEHRLGVPADHQELAEGRLVEDGDVLPGCRLLRRRPGQPRGTAPGVVELGRRTARGEDVRSLPSHLRAEDRSLGGEQVMERRPAKGPGARQLPVGPRHRVVQAEHLSHPVAQPSVVGVERGEAADVDGHEVAGRLAFDDPLGQRPPGAAARRDPDRVEPGPDEEPPQTRCLAQNELVVGRETLGAVVELLEAGVLQCRDPVEGRLHQHAEVIPILLEELELEGVGQRIGRDPRLRRGLEATHDETTHLLLHVRVPVGVAQDRADRGGRPPWPRSPRRSARPSGGARRHRRGGPPLSPTGRRSSRPPRPRRSPGR